MSKIDEVLAIAKKYVDEGYKEGANNHTIFGHFRAQNQPWCASFVSYCFEKAGRLQLVAQMPRGFINCNDGLKWFAQKGRLVPIGQAQRGDIVFMNFDADPTTAEHVGIVYVPQHDKKQLVTFEGNTAANNAGAQANGDGCYKKTRPYGKIVAVARPDWNNP